jgi:hypothetical protein
MAQVNFVLTPTAVPSSASLTFGADVATSAFAMQKLVANGKPSDAPTVLDEESGFTCPIAASLSKVAWNSQFGNVNVSVTLNNGAPSAVLALVATSGVAAISPAIAVAEGDVVRVRIDAPGVPGKTLLSLS